MTANLFPHLVMTGLITVLTACAGMDTTNVGGDQSDQPLSSGSRPVSLTQGQRFEDWTAGCEKINDSGQESCFVYQTIVNNDTEKPVLQMAVGHTPQDGQLTAILTVPLGVSIPLGVNMMLGERNIAHLDYERCVSKGCIAGLKMDRNLVTQLGKEQDMKIVMHDGSRSVALPVSLKGFSDGLTALGVEN
jgi:invasion protein IalB